jgi:HEAT repeat protein
MAAFFAWLGLLLLLPRSIEDLKYQEHDAAHWRAQTGADLKLEDRLQAMRALDTLAFWATLHYDNSQPWVDQEIVPAVVPLLEDPEPRIRELATRALKNCRKTKADVTPLFLKRLDDADPEVRNTAAVALAFSDRNDLPQAAIQLLAERLLAETAPQVRENLARALRCNGTPGIAALQELWKDKDAKVRVNAVAVFEFTYPQQKPAATPPALLPRFTELLNDKEAEVQFAAARAIAGMEPLPKDVVLKLIAHGNADVRLHIANKLFDAARKNPDVPFKKELLALAASDEKVRQRNAERLGRLGPEALPLLRGLLDDQSANVRGAAAYGLALLGRQAETAVPRLQQLLGDMASIEREHQERVCHAAGRALNHILGSTEYTKGLPKMEYSGK